MVYTLWLFTTSHFYLERAGFTICYFLHTSCADICFWVLIKHNKITSTTSILANYAAAAFAALYKIASERTEVLKLYESSTKQNNSEGEHTTAAPIMNRIVETSGWEAIHKMTNFTGSEISRIYEDCEISVSAGNNVGKGKKFAFAISNITSIMLTVYKNGGAWVLLAAILKQETSTFQKIVSTHLNFFCEWAHDTLLVA